MERVTNDPSLTISCQTFITKKVNKALASLYKVWLAVIAVLSIQFARTIALAVSMSKFFNTPMNTYVVPAVRAAVPNEYSRWIPVLSGW